MKKTILLFVCLCLALFANAQVSKTVNLTTAGSLYSFLSKTERTTVTNLTLTGTIDARDFKTMRDSMTVLSVLDIKDVVIAPYTGIINKVYNIQTFEANTIPNSAFFYADLPSITNTTLTSIILPSTTVAIGTFAFFNCIALKTILISKLIISIAPEVFWNCGAVITVDSQNPNYSSQDGVLFNKEKTILIQCPSSKVGAYTIPSTVNEIAGPFMYCNLLTSITIPESVTKIEDGSLTPCSNLMSVYSKNTIPIVLTSQLCQTSIILYVPIGSKEAYQSALYWKDIKNIVETDFVGFDELGNEKIIVFPNPAKESISVKTEGKSEVLIFSLSGSLMLQTSVNSHELVFLNSLPASVYIIKVVTDKATIVQQFIKL